MDKSLIKELFFLRQYIRANVDIFVNTTRLGVIIPPELYTGNQAQLFQLGMGLPIPTSDLKENWEGIRVTLSFGRQPFQCQFPWSSIFVIRNPTDPAPMNAITFPEDAPYPVPQASTGTDDGESSALGPTGHPGTPFKPRPKATLPKGWGGLIQGGANTTNDDKEPA